MELLAFRGFEFSVALSGVFNWYEVICKFAFTCDCLLAKRLLCSTPLVS